MKRTTVILGLFAFFSSTLLFGKDWNGYVQGNTGITAGKIGEYIYSSGKGDDQYIISSLDWNIKPGINMGFDAGINYKNLYLDGGLNYILPLSCGHMYDLDYRPGMTVNYSTFDNNITLAMNTYAELSYKFKIKKGFYITPNAVFEYSFYDFNADNGSGYYGAASYSKSGKDVWWNDENARHAKKVSGIQYQRSTIYTFAGAGFGYSDDRWNINFTTYISPFTKTKGLDYHKDERDVAEKADFYLYYLQHNYFSRIKEKLTIEYYFTKLVGINLNIDFIYGSKSNKGQTATNKYRSSQAFGFMANTSDWQILSQPSGADIIQCDGKVGVKVKF